MTFQWSSGFKNSHIWNPNQFALEQTLTFTRLALRDSGVQFTADVQASLAKFNADNNATAQKIAADTQAIAKNLAMIEGGINNLD